MNHSVFQFLTHCHNCNLIIQSLIHNVIGCGSRRCMQEGWHWSPRQLAIIYKRVAQILKVPDLVETFLSSLECLSLVVGGEGA